MSEHAYQFLIATMGEEGSKALKKACEKSEDLKTVILPRAVMAWLSFLAPHGFEGTIPGTEATLNFSKAEKDGYYAGAVTWNGQTFRYRDAGLYRIAAAVALAIGAKAKEVSSTIESTELTALGKSVDVLVKAHAANEQLKKADAPGKTALPIKPLGPAAAGAPTAPKIGATAPPKLPQPVGPAPQQAGKLPGTKPLPKLPGMGKKPIAPKTPALPALKVGKSELSVACSMCGKSQFAETKFVGCSCLKALAKSVTSTTKPDGVLLTFGSSWTRDDVESLLELLRGN